MAFTNAEKVDIRRFLGFEAYGAGPSGFQSWRYFKAYGFVEFRLNNMAPEEEAVVRTTYLQPLKSLELAILGTSDNLDTDQAAVWKHNKDEHADRERLFRSWRIKFCNFMGVPPGRGLGDNSSLVV